MGAFAAEHFPDDPPGLVAYAASLARARGLDPTPDSLRPIIDQYNGTAEEASA